MPRRGRRMGSDATAPPKSLKTMSRDASKMLPERSTVSESVKTAATVNPTTYEIAAVAYQLWLDNGCPVGSDQEDWFRAEAMLKNALVATCEDLSRRPSILSCGTRTESEMLAEFPWEGHWEVWESEWSGARWIWDLRPLHALRFRIERAERTPCVTSQH
jgi:hypothetical protein